MDQKTIKQLDRLTGRCEALQTKLSEKKERSEEHRRAYERVADAKDRLLEALHIAQGW